VDNIGFYINFETLILKCVQRKENILLRLKNRAKMHLIPNTALNAYNYANFDWIILKLSENIFEM